jgi:hypothetical protein
MYKKDKKEKKIIGKITLNVTYILIQFSSSKNDF